MTGKARRFLVPAVSTLVMLIVLLGLGTWQIYRLHWKEGILAQIARAEAAPAVPLPAVPGPFMKVAVTGRFLYDKAARYGAEVRDMPAGPVMGSYQIVPLVRAGHRPILVERGWVPDLLTTPIAEPKGEVTVTGYIHGAEYPNWFSAADDPAARRFFTLDPAAMAASMGLSDPMPFTLVAMGVDRPEMYPAPAQHLPRPPNNHLSYAITWYGLAASLAVIFGVWARKAWRS